MLQLPIVFSILTAIVAGAAGIAYGRRLHGGGVTLGRYMRVREMPLIPVCLVLFIGSIVLTNWIFSNPQVAWDIPAAIEYLLLPIVWAFKLAFVTFATAAIATIAWRQQGRTRYVVVFFAIVVALTVDLLGRYAHQPFLPDLEHKTKNGVILQTNGSTCAAAACANIARYFGVERTEADMVKVLNTTWAGTSAAQIVYGMRSLGFEAKKVNSRDRNPRDLTTLAILLVDSGGQVDGHAVAFMGMTGPECTIYDPATGPVFINAEKLKETWRGHAIEIRMP
jgi:predicted double-glycine peptidase